MFRSTRTRPVTTPGAVPIPLTSAGPVAPAADVGAATGLDPNGEVRQREHLVVAQHPACGRFLVVVDPQVATVGAAHDLEALDADAGLEDREALLVDDVGVGFDLPAHHHLAEPERAFDHDARRIGGGRIDREHDAGAVGVDHALHHDGDRGLGIDVLRRAIRDAARAKEGRPAVDDALDELIVAAHVRERLVHAGERRSGGVFAGRR